MPSKHRAICRWCMNTSSRKTCRRRQRRAYDDDHREDPVQQQCSGWSMLGRSMLGRLQVLLSVGFLTSEEATSNCRDVGGEEPGKRSTPSFAISALTREATNVTTMTLPNEDRAIRPGRTRVAATSPPNALLKNCTATVLLAFFISCFVSAPR
jgi:hypothetical protein